MMKKSLRLLQLEKFLIILKEMEFICNILKYFKGYDDSNLDNKKKNIQRLEKDIENLQIRIKSLIKLNQDMKNMNSVNFIIFYNYVRTQIEEMLLVINALYTKMNQLFGEMLNQYLPYPTFFGRRYSSHGVMMYLDNYYNFIYKKLLGEDKTNDIILNWSHSTNFKYKVLRNRDISRENYNKDTHNDYIELPYWYYELPFLIPAITHEVVFLSLKNRYGKKETKIYEKYREFYNYVESFFIDRSNYLVQEIGDILGYKQIVEEISKDIFCDVVAYKLHSVSYLYILLHNVFGEDIAKNFIKIIYDEKDGRTIKEYKIVPNDWFFSPKKDHNFLRLYILCNYVLDGLDKNNKNYKFVMEIKELLNTVMDLENDKNISSFEKLYKENFPNYYPTFKVVKNYLSQIYEWLRVYGFDLDDVVKDIKNGSEKYFFEFDFLWDKRFEVLKENKEDIVPRKGGFRNKIHTKVSGLSDIEENVYLLTFRKFRKDLFRGAKKSFDFDGFIKNAYDQNRWMAYGIYDMVMLEKKDINIDLISELKEIKKSMVSFDEKEDIYFFDSKHLLMKLTDKCLIHQNNKNSNDNFNLIANIEIKKDSDQENGYHNLSDAIEGIYKIFEKNGDFYKMDLYKSLGPKDITLIVQKVDIDTLFKIVNALNSEVFELNRTFSVFCSNDTNLSIKGKDGKYNFVTYIRVPKDKKKSIESVLYELSSFADVFQTTGVMDYTIVWRDIVLLEDLFEKYKKIVPLVTDFQTKIEKVVL